MTELNVTFRFDDKELDSAIRFIGASNDTVQMVRRDYFEQAPIIDFSKIEDALKRHYHMNGIVAMIVSIQEELNQQYATNNI